MDHSWPNLFHFLQINHIHHQDSIYKNKITSNSSYVTSLLSVPINPNFNIGSVDFL